MADAGLTHGVWLDEPGTLPARDDADTALDVLIGLLLDRLTSELGLDRERARGWAAGG